MKTEDMRRNKKGKRVYLNEVQIQDLLKQLNTFFESFVEISRIKVVDEQIVETLIYVEALLPDNILEAKRLTRHQGLRWYSKPLKFPRVQKSRTMKVCYHYYSCLDPVPCILNS